MCHTEDGASSQSPLHQALLDVSEMQRSNRLQASHVEPPRHMARLDIKGGMASNPAPASSLARSPTFASHPWPQGSPDASPKPEVASQPPPASSDPHLQAAAVLPNEKKFRGRTSCTRCRAKKLRCDADDNDGPCLPCVTSRVVCSKVRRAGFRIRASEERQRLAQLSDSLGVAEEVVAPQRAPQRMSKGAAQLRHDQIADEAFSQLCLRHMALLGQMRGRSSLPSFMMPVREPTWSMFRPTTIMFPPR